MFDTYGNTDKRFSLSPQSRSRSSRSFCSRLAFLPLGTEWEERTRGRYSFLNHHRLSCVICFPLQGTLMILSMNDICLRPIRTLQPDNISTGIMSGWISSAPLRWAGEKFGKRGRWITSQAWLHVWPHATRRLELMRFLSLCSLFHFWAAWERLQA